MNLLGPSTFRANEQLLTTRPVFGKIATLSICRDPVNNFGWISGVTSRACCVDCRFAFDIEVFRSSANVSRKSTQEVDKISWHIPSDNCGCNSLDDILAHREKPMRTSPRQAKDDAACNNHKNNQLKDWPDSIEDIGKVTVWNTELQ